MLSAYRVPDLTDHRGMFCGYLLAHLGAQVTAVEPPGGCPSRRIPPFADDESPPENGLWWQAYGRGKSSLVIDLDTGPGRAKLLEMAADADFLTESFLHAGADAACAALIALRARHATGHGQQIEVSAQQSSAQAALGMNLAVPNNGGFSGRRVTGGLRGTYPVRFLFPCRDGHVTITLMFGHAFEEPNLKFLSWLCEHGAILGLCNNRRSKSVVAGWDRKLAWR